MADTTTSAWCTRKWKPSGSSTTKQYRANLVTTLNTYATYCTVSYTHRLEINSSVGHNDYHWSCGGSASGSGTVDTVFGDDKIVQCKKATSSQVTRGHSAKTITVSGTIWASSSGGSNPWNGQKVTATKTYTVPALASYAVKYYANGGIGTIADGTKWYGEALTLSNGTDFTRVGYTLVGWNTSADGTGTHYNLSQSYTGNAGLELYAEWEAIVVHGLMKIDNIWEEGTFYIKINGVWIEPYACYVKINGSWIEMT